MLLTNTLSKCGGDGGVTENKPGQIVAIVRTRGDDRSRCVLWKRFAKIYFVVAKQV